MTENTKAIKELMQKKFGSISEFARQTGISRYDLQLQFALKKPDEKFMALVHRRVVGMKPKPPEGLINPSKLEGLRRAINASGGVGAFCRANKGFSRITVYQILDGRYKRMSSGVKKLFKKVAV